MFFREKNSYKYLPIEILLKIYNHLNPEQAAMTATVNQSASEFIRGNLLWVNKFQRHFPHRYNAIAPQKDINWYVYFLDTYYDEYRYLPSDERQLFSLVKESDRDSLEKTRISLTSFEITDRNHKSLLSWAQLIGNQPVLNYFYQIAQKNVLVKNRYSRTNLYWALACHKDYKHIQSLILQGSMLTEKYFGAQYRPIHIAVQEGLLEVVQGLMEENLDLLLEQHDAYGQTPLFWAAKKGHIEILDYLITKSPNVNVSSRNTNPYEKHGRTPLHWAAIHGHAESVSKLLNAGAIANIAQTTTKSQAIHLAASKGHLNVVKVLLDKNPELLEQRDMYHQTPLLWAAAEGHLEMLNYLISENANLDVSTDNPNGINHGKTPLHWAAERGHNEVVKTLLEAGMMPSLTKPINKSKLNEEVRAEVALREHPSKRHRKL